MYECSLFDPGPVVVEVEVQVVEVDDDFEVDDLLDLVVLLLSPVLLLLSIG